MYMYIRTHTYICVYVCMCIKINVHTTVLHVGGLCWVKVLAKAKTNSVGLTFFF